MNATFIEQNLWSYVDEHTGRLVEILRDLVSIPSENTPPLGAEASCQRYVANFLAGAGWTPEVYSITDVEGLREHPLFRPERNYENRPNVAARRRGNGGGHSLLLSGHIDTVPRGSFVWKRDPFGGEIEGNRLYGRGANDMKGGVATNLFVAEAIEKLGLTLAGDLIVETVVDEEFGGVNGTLAGRVKGILADAAIISEPSFLRVCPAQRGGRIAHITLESAGGVLTEGALPTGVIDQLTFFLTNLKHFAECRKSVAPRHEIYAGHKDPVPVTVTKIITSPWGTSEPITIPEQCKIELYWQAIPGEELDAIDGQFLSWIDALVSAPGGPLTARPKIEFPVRWLPGSAIAATEPLVQELAECATRVLGRRPVIAGIEGPCDMYVFHQEAHMPAVLWGARGGNTHAADEYVEIDSLVQAAKTLLSFVCRWCQVI